MLKIYKNIRKKMIWIKYFKYIYLCFFHIATNIFIFNLDWIYFWIKDIFNYRNCKCWLLFRRTCRPTPLKNLGAENIIIKFSICIFNFGWLFPIFYGICWWFCCYLWKIIFPESCKDSLPNFISNCSPSMAMSTL